MNDRFHGIIPLGRIGAAALPALFLASLAFAGAPSPRPDSGPPMPNEVASLGSFRFENGETISDLKISYVTHGKLSAARDNAILILHAFAGDNHALDYLIGPGKALDTEKYFIIAADYIANARLRGDLSTGPTNSGLKMHFPRITARDWINADYKLVKDYLGIDRLLAATGDSVGGMTSLQLAVSRPDFVRSIIPIGGTAHTNPQTQLLVRHMQQIIAFDPAWYGGMYEVNPTAGLELALMDLVPWLYSPDFYPTTLTTPEKVRDFERFWRRVWSSLVPQDARDIYYQLDGWAKFNIGDTPGFHGDINSALNAITAKTLLVGIKEDLLTRSEEQQFAKNAIRDASYLEISSPTGHIAVVGGLDRKFDEAINREIASFLATVK